MKCPFNNFEECLVQECPACVYEEEIIQHKDYVNGIKYKNGTRICWVQNETKYEFKSCKLIDKFVKID